MAEESNFAGDSTTTPTNNNVFVSAGKRGRDLTTASKYAIVQKLSLLLVEGELPKGAITKTAVELGLSRKTVSVYLNRANKTLSNQDEVDFEAMRKGNGRSYEEAVKLLFIKN